MTGRLAEGASKLQQHIHLRGLGFIVAGASSIYYGASIAIDPRYGTVRGIQILLQRMCMEGWGWVWIGCGLIAVAYGLLRPVWDVPGIVASIAPPLMWATAYLIATIAGASSNAWGSVGMWLSRAGLVLILMRATRTVSRGH
ncbi:MULTISPECIES: hypothetical protein [Streptomyces]|uniref:Integral membrane protein n=1 Tax=Streptomyces doudnae TaxID=3075536 RepID=A0ABD5ELX0_9ACTN|nr:MULTISPECIES: hypothetical protein [unclassified Streptomyces]MDT0435595.1 hypothetical protein [Streptomyces sp. DSM 41981]MYQ62550.1 hypothetical protein [Streptomyces sp. SID4950]SCD39800.1 hypothetical protein GA0115242_104854 [Streptomyces sp. SolWspMP-5a-2]